jgi:hypothetical protein
MKRNNDYVLSPHHSLADFLQKLGLKAEIILVFPAVNVVLGRLDPVEIVPNSES